MSQEVIRQTATAAPLNLDESKRVLRKQHVHTVVGWGYGVCGHEANQTRGAEFREGGAPTSAMLWKPTTHRNVTAGADGIYMCICACSHIRYKLLDQHSQGSTRCADLGEVNCFGTSHVSRWSPYGRFGERVDCLDYVRQDREDACEVRIVGFEISPRY